MGNCECKRNPAGTSQEGYTCMHALKIETNANWKVWNLRLHFYSFQADRNSDTCLIPDWASIRYQASVAHVFCSWYSCKISKNRSCIIPKDGCSHFSNAAKWTNRGASGQWVQGGGQGCMNQDVVRYFFCLRANVNHCMTLMDVFGSFSDFFAGEKRL